MSDWTDELDRQRAWLQQPDDFRADPAERARELERRARPILVAGEDRGFPWGTEFFTIAGKQYAVDRQAAGIAYRYSDRWGDVALCAQAIEEQLGIFLVHKDRRLGCGISASMAAETVGYAYKSGYTSYVCENDFVAKHPPRCYSCGGWYVINEENDPENWKHWTFNPVRFPCLNSMKWEGRRAVWYDFSCSDECKQILTRFNERAYFLCRKKQLQDVRRQARELTAIKLARKRAAAVKRAFSQHNQEALKSLLGELTAGGTSMPS